MSVHETEETMYRNCLEGMGPDCSPECGNSDVVKWFTKEAQRMTKAKKASPQYRTYVIKMRKASVKIRQITEVLKDQGVPAPRIAEMKAVAMAEEEIYKAYVDEAISFTEALRRIREAKIDPKELTRRKREKVANQLVKLKEQARLLGMKV